MPEIIQLGLAEAGGHPMSPDSRHKCVPLLSQVSKVRETLWVPWQFQTCSG